MFLQTLLTETFAARWAVLVGMVSEQFEEWLHRLDIQGIDLLLLLSLLENEPTFL
jgi:hypothetical protein